MIQNQPYFQHPDNSPEFQTTIEFQPNMNQVPRDDYFSESHYTWHHDDSDQTGALHPPMYQQQQWNPLTHHSPAMYHPWVPHTHDLNDLSPAMYHSGFPDADDCYPHPLTGWDHYSADYHHDWYHPRYYQQANGYYPAGYQTLDSYYW